MILTAWAMTAGTFQLFISVVLAAKLLDEFGIDRWQIGVLGAVNTGVGAVVAPRLGRLADALGARRSMVALLLISAVGFFLSAVAPGYWFLFLASAVSGLAQGACNPVTNKVIVEEVPPAKQGLVTGVKQSGVQFSVFLAGATLPTAGSTIGWRWAMAISGFLTLATAVVTHVRFADRHGEYDEVVTTQATPGEVVALDPFVRQVAIYAFLLGLTAGGMTRFYPLYAHEVLGYSETTAGLAVGVAGVVAIVSRVVWGQALDNVISARPALRLLAVGSAGCALMLLAAESFGAWLLWPTVVLMAFTVVAWNVVAMLSVIRSVPSHMSGRATGIVLLGFLGGLTIVAPIVGYTVDRVGSYRPAWIGLLLIALAGSMVVRDRTPVASESVPTS